ncbi:MAG: hypothetical protein JSV53_12115 [candidate division WOR-3 bacterium]|jgi:hypothetical protein|nr:MAG: hypothetical protein JSV53_12115 [candidate division WOR-3 bacterium]
MNKQQIINQVLKHVMDNGVDAYAYALATTPNELILSIQRGENLMPIIDIILRNIDVKSELLWAEERRYAEIRDQLIDL